MSTPQHPTAVTVLVTRRIKPGQESAFESLMGNMMAAAKEFTQQKN